MQKSYVNSQSMGFRTEAGITVKPRANQTGGKFTHGELVPVDSSCRQAEQLRLSSRCRFLGWFLMRSLLVDSDKQWHKCFSFFFLFFFFLSLVWVKLNAVFCRCRPLVLSVSSGAGGGWGVNLVMTKTVLKVKEIGSCRSSSFSFQSLEPSSLCPPAETERC